MEGEEEARGRFSARHSKPGGTDGGGADIGCTSRSLQSGRGEGRFGAFRSILSDGKPLTDMWGIIWFVV